MKFTWKQIVVVFIASAIGYGITNWIRNYPYNTINDKDVELAFYKEAWDSDFEISEAQQKFREKHPNMIYYNQSAVYYCPMVIDCPLAPCGDYKDTKYRVWVTANGQPFRTGYVLATKSDSLFENGKVIYWDKGGISIIDTSNTWFTVY